MIQIALIMLVVIQGGLVLDRLKCRHLDRLLGHLTLRSVDLAVKPYLCDLLLLMSCSASGLNFAIYLQIRF